MTQMNNQGWTFYPQYGTNFWGTNADNNYGFGTSNIENNIENRQQTMTPVPQMATQPSTPQIQQQPNVWADQNKRNALALDKELTSCEFKSLSSVSY